MTDLNRIEIALRNADAAGDVEAARRLAAEYRRLQQAGQTQGDQEGLGPYRPPGGFAFDPVAEQRAIDEARAQKIESMGAGKAALIGVGRGMLDVGQGLRQIATQAGERLGLAEDGAAQNYTREVMDQRGRFQELSDAKPIAAGAGRLAGNIVATPVPGVGAIGTTGGRALAAAAGGALGAGSQFVDEGDSRAMNAALGGVLGGIGQRVLGEGLRSGATAAANRAGQRAARREAAEKAAAYARENNLPLFADDISSGELIRNAGNAIDDIPLIGGGNARIAQAEAGAAAANKFRDKFSVEAPEEIGDLLQGSLRRQYENFKSQASKMYDQAFSELESAGAKVQYKSAKKAAQEIIENESRQLQPDESIIGMAQALIERSDADDFATAHAMRSGVLGDLRDVAKGQTTTRMETALERIASAIDDDMATAAEAAGGLQSWRNANRFYAENLKPFHQRAIRRALDADEPEKAADLILGAGERLTAGTKDRASVARTVYNSLDEEGREAVRYGLMSKAIDASTGENGVLNFQTFSTQLDKMSQRSGVFFSASDQATLEGMKKYFNAARNSSTIATKFMNGRSVMAPMLFGSAALGALVDGAATAMMATPVLATRALLRTKRGTSMLQAMSRLRPDSAPARKLASEITDFLIPRTSALSAPAIAPSEDREELQQETAQ